MRRIPAAIAVSAMLTGLGCAHRPHAASPNEAAANPDMGESGLEATTFICGADERTLARALAPATDSPLPISQSMADLWAAHGFRLLVIPTDQTAHLLGDLRAASRGVQKQWLGQAYSWTEIVRGADASSKVVALDAERIRLPAGTLRLLARSWIEPGPPSTGAGTTPSAMLHVELVPQNFELRRPEEVTDPLALSHPSIEAESQGLLFSRLYASMSLAPGQSLLVIPDRPEADWTKLAAEPAPSTGTADAAPPTTPTQPKSSGAAPRIGEVVHSNPRTAARSTSSSATDEPAFDGPIGPRVLTLGEALLLVDPDSGGSSRSLQRTVLLLTPRLPSEFRLLPPQPLAAPAATPTGAPVRRG